MIKALFPALALFLLCTTSGCSEPKDNTTLLTEAQQQFQNNDAATAIITLKNILKNTPDNSEARELLGKIYLENDNFLAAKKELKRALANNPSQESTVVLLARTLLALNDHKNVIELIANTSFQSNENNLHALVLAGQAHLGLEQLEQAKQKIAQANSIDASAKYSLFGQALIAAYEQNKDLALNILSKLITDYGDFQEALLLEGSVYSNNEQYQQAANSYSKYLKLKPENFAIKTLVAHNYIKAGMFDNARPYVEQLLAINDQHPTSNLLAAQLAYNDQNYEAAKQLANQVMNSTDNGLAQMISGLSSYQLDEIEQAYYQLNAIADSLPPAHKVHKILAILQVKLGYQNDLNNNLPTDSTYADDATFYANLGTEYLIKGNKKAAKTMFNKAAAITPNDANIKTQLGLIKLSENDESGIRDLENAISIAPNFEKANIALAMNLLRNGKIAQAETTAAQWLEQQPASATAMILNGNIAVKAGKLDKAKTWFHQAAKVAPQNITPLFNLAVIYSQESNYDESNKLLNKLFSVDPEYPYAYRLAIDNAIATNQEDALEKQLQSLINKSESATWPRVVLARRNLIKNNVSEAISILEQLIDYENLPKTYFQTYEDALIRIKQTDKLANVYLRWQQAQPKNEFAYLNQIQFLEKQGDFHGALAVIEKVLKLPNFKNDLHFQSLQAYYLLASSQFELAEKKINRLVAIAPEHAFILRLQGQLAMAKYHHKDAINYLLKSFNLSPKDETALYLVNSYKNNNEIKNAIDFVEHLLNQQPDKLIYRTLLAELYITHAPAKAITLYQALLKADPNNTVNLNNIAWLYYQKQDYPQAEKYAKNAIILAPNNADILDTYGLILTKLNKLKQAIEILEQARNFRPNNKEIATHLSMAYKADNQPEAAEQVLQSLPSS